MRRADLSLKKALLVVVAAMLAVMHLTGCSGGGGGGATSPTGTLKVSLTDRQSDDFAEVWIKVRAIKIVPVGYDQDCSDDDPNLIDIPFDPSVPVSRSFNILDLAFVQQLLGTQILPVGTYSQVRLILEPNPTGGQPPVNYLTLTSDTASPRTKIPLKTPSAQQSGLKVKGTFEVKPGINAIALDFDPNTAIVKRGNTQQTAQYILKPTGIRIIQTADYLATYGSVSGTVTSTFRDWSSATVSVKRRGTINDTDPIAAGRIFSSYTSSTGKWESPFAVLVPPTTSSVSYKAFIAAAGFRVYSSPAVPVIERQTTDLGEIQLAPMQ